MRPPTQRPRWRCLDPGCPAHTWQWIPERVDPLHGGRDAIEAHRLDVHGDDNTFAVLETEEAGVAEWYDTDGGPVCGDCYYGCPRPPHHATCDRTGCACPCRRDDAHYDTTLAARARELDDRDHAHLGNIARDLEAEARPRVEELRRERFGPRGYPTRGRA